MRTDRDFKETKTLNVFNDLKVHNDPNEETIRFHQRMIFDDISLLVFDADDTLWDCQSHFKAVEEEYCGLLSKYAEPRRVSEQLFMTEQGNMEQLGFGAQAFTISLVENALKISNGRLTATETAEILRLGRSLLNIPCTPLEGVRETLEALSDYRKILFTKGELLDQRRKLERSGLQKHFSDVVIVADKTAEEHLRVCQSHSVSPAQTLFIGNSFRSDIAPALSIGASAVHIPFHTTWKLEQTEEFAHHNLTTVAHFNEILAAFR